MASLAWRQFSRRFVKHTSFRPAESCALAIRPARAADESRGHAAGAGLGDGACPQNRFVFLAASSGNCRLLRGRCCLHFIIFKGWRDDLCFLRIGAVNRLAVMPKRSLGKPFRHPDNLCPFRPCVAIAMQGYAGDACLVATAAETAGAVVGCERGQLWEQCAGCGYALNEIPVLYPRRL